MKRLIFLSIGILVFLACCTKNGKDFPIEPTIAYLGLSTNKINATDSNAKITIKFSFTDGDGDIATDPKDLVNNIFLKYSRDTTSADSTYSLPIPYIADYLRPKKGGIEGSGVINLSNAFFPVKDSLHLALGGDTVTFKIYLKDTLGHKSNVITTDPIYISF